MNSLRSRSQNLDHIATTLLAFAPPHAEQDEGPILRSQDLAHPDFNWEGVMRYKPTIFQAVQWIFHLSISSPGRVSRIQKGGCTFALDFMTACSKALRTWAAMTLASERSLAGAICCTKPSTHSPAPFSRPSPLFPPCSAWAASPPALSVSAIDVVTSHPRQEPSNWRGWLLCKGR